MIFIHIPASTKGYAELQHSTNPPAPPLPAEPVQYANITRTQTDSMQPVTTQEW